MRQPGGNKISMFAALGIVCFLLLGFSGFLFINRDISTLKSLARSEERGVLSMRGMSGKVRENFLRDVKNRLFAWEKILRLEEREKNLIRKAETKEEDLEGKDVSDTLDKRLSVIPYRFFYNIKGVEKLRKFGWAASIVCFKVSVLKLSRALWLFSVPLVLILGELRRRKTFLTNAHYSSEAFHYCRGLTFVFLIGIPLGYLVIPLRIPAALVLYVWILSTSMAGYTAFSNLAKKL